MARSLTGPATKHPISWLAVKRANHLPQSISLSMTGMIASVALCVAVSLMISSFRLAVSEWLDHVLPADVYARIQKGEASLSPDEQLQLSQLEGLRRTEFQQVLEWPMLAERPPVAVIVRALPLKTPQDRLPITGQLLDPHPSLPSVWVSEAMRDLYRWEPGSIQRLGLLPEGSVFVAGVWRDYARQHGSIIIESSQWLRARGGHQQLEASDVSWWLTEPGRGSESLLAQLPEGLRAKLEIRSASDIRALSLELFDRSFVVTYALQAVALLIGLLGLSSTLAAQAIARTQELAMLQLLGLHPAACTRLLLLEAASSLALALLWGSMLGLALAWVLIEVVNPQSFHWSMPMRIPAGLMMLAIGGVWSIGVLSCLVLSKQLLKQPMLQSLKQDW
jgi:putative ABC transport system permease protein